MSLLEKNYLVFVHIPNIDTSTYPKCFNNISNKSENMGKICAIKPNVAISGFRRTLYVGGSVTPTKHYIQRWLYNAEKHLYVAFILIEKVFPYNLALW